MLWRDTFRSARTTANLLCTCSLMYKKYYISREDRNDESRSRLHPGDDLRRRSAADAGRAVGGDVEGASGGGLGQTHLDDDRVGAGGQQDAESRGPPRETMFV